MKILLPGLYIVDMPIQLIKMMILLVSGTVKLVCFLFVKLLKQFIAVC